MPHVALKPHAADNTPHEPCICIFSALYDPHVGGVETYTKALRKRLLTRDAR